MVLESRRNAVRKVDHDVSVHKGLTLFTRQSSLHDLSWPGFLFARRLSIRQHSSKLFGVCFLMFWSWVMRKLFSKCLTSYIIEELSSKFRLGAADDIDLLKRITMFYKSSLWLILVSKTETERTKNCSRDHSRDKKMRSWKNTTIYRRWRLYQKCSKDRNIERIFDSNENSPYLFNSPHTKL